MILIEDYQKKYEDKGLLEYMLKNKKNLKDVHKIDFDKSEGVESFKPENREDILLPFLLNFLNSWGLGARFAITPKSFSYRKHDKYPKFTYEKNGIESYVYIHNIHTSG